MTATMAFTAAALSDQGRRPNNEDCVLAEPEAGIFAVIDGIGGGPFGEEAAAIAHEVLRERLRRSDAAPERRLREAIALANNEIFRRTRPQPEMRGCGCVLVAAIVENGSVTIAHVGDARAYLLRPGRIERLTMDHSPVGEMERRGELSEDQAALQPRRHQVYRQVGGAERDLDDPEFIEVNSTPIGDDSALLLCSDGLSDALLSPDIRAIVESTEGSVARTAARLVEAAFERGSQDNISVVYVEGASYRSATRVPFAPQPNRSRRQPHRLRRAVLPLVTAAMLAIIWQNRPRLQQAPELETPGVWRVGVEAEYHTITAALDRARLGDTISVAPGRYEESLQLKSGVRIVAEPRRQAVIAGSQPVAVIALRVTEARFEGFRIQGEGRLLIGVLAGNSTLDMEDTEITGALYSGVQVMGGSEGHILHCAVHDNPGAGLRVLDSAAPEVTNNLFAANGQQPEVAAGSTARITGNAFLEAADKTKDQSFAERFLEKNFFPLQGDASHVRRRPPGRVPPGKPDQ